VHSPLRVMRPLRRVGRKDAGAFAPIGWDEAVAEIAHRWRAIIAEHGAEAILPFSYAGSMGRVPVLPELLVQPVGAAAPAPGTANGDAGPHRRRRARHRRR
jgi:hypothetical protein